MSIVLIVGGALIATVITLLAIFAAFARSRHIDSRRWILLGGVTFPVVVLSILFGYAFTVGENLHPHASQHSLRIRVVGKQWWWEVRYEGRGRTEILLANELHIPVGRDVEILLSTDDVIHSFWVPSIAGKVDMIPGRTNQLIMKADTPGAFRGQCAEYCGAQHALMAFAVVAEPAEVFEEWLAHQARPAQLPGDPAVAAGAELFMQGGCAACHAIRGTDAAGTLGPDLTHVGSRRTLAAGTLRNHVGTMAGWIAGPQDLKPAALMPNATIYSGTELRTLAAWLEALK